MQSADISGFTDLEDEESKPSEATEENSEETAESLEQDDKKKKSTDIARELAEAFTALNMFVAEAAEKNKTEE